MALSKVDPNFLNVSQVGGKRNLIINGAMQVAQRGNSFTSQNYTLDRWYQLLSGGTATVTQETFALGSEVAGCSQYLKQATSTGNDYCGVIYKVEDVKSLPQGTSTISFYAKGTNPGQGSFQLVIYRMHDGSTVYDTLLDTTVTVTSSWQRFIHSFTVPTLSGMTTPTANSLIYIRISQSGSDTSTNAWELNLTGVQLEVGDTATPFEHRSYGEELNLCLRYFEKINYANTELITLGTCNTTTTANGVLEYTKKRVAPSVDLPNAGQSSGNISFLTSTGGYPSGTGDHSVQTPAIDQCRITAFSYSGLNAAGPSYLFSTGSTSISIDAEL